MKRFARALVAMLGMAVLGSFVLLVPQKNATAVGGAPVTIMSPLPLPVTGSVNAAVTGTVSAQQNGLWNVGLTGTPTVSLASGSTVGITGNVGVANTPANPVPVSVQQSTGFKTLLLSGGSGTSYNEVLPDGTVSTSAFTIAPTQKFVITDVSWVAGCINFGSFSCPQSAGNAVVIQLGTGSYLSEATYASGVFGNGLFAGRSDHFTSGIVVTQLPAPTIFPVASGNGEQVSQVVLQGYLVGVAPILP